MAVKVLVITTLLAGGLLVFAVSPALLRHYVGTSPSEPEIATGQVQRFDQHGTVVYLSNWQQAAVYGSSALGMALLAVSVFGLRRWFAAGSK